MSINKLLELVCNHLPSDIRRNEFIQKNIEHKFSNSDKEGVLYLLANCKRINWQAYKENYADVKEAGINPAWHFINYGIYEGRKLWSWHPLRQATYHSRPRVSVIVPNYNNELFIGKCLSSLVEQTINDIEIIVVDDASHDASPEIVHNLSCRDKRIKLLRHDKNRGTHSARKTGVAVATGEYVMFLDGDDFYEPHTCERAWQAVALGYDIVSFNINVISHGGWRKKDINYFDKLFNSLPAGSYTVNDVMKIAFEDKQMSHNIWSRIFLTEIAQKSFEEMDDNYLVFAEDLYEFLVLVSNSRNMLKITDRLYNYSLNIGITSTDDKYKNIKIVKERNCALDAIDRFCKTRGLYIHNNNIRERLTKDSYQVLSKIPNSMINEFLNLLCSISGPLKTALMLAKTFHNKWDIVSTKLQYYNKNRRIENGIKKVGIYYYRIAGGGIETTMLNMVRVLKKRGYEVSLILEEIMDEDIAKNIDVQVYYLSPSGSGEKSIAKHLVSWNSIIQAGKLDLIFYMWVHEPLCFWDNLLFQLMGLGVIGSLRFDHNLEMLYRGRNYKHSSFLNTLRTLDKIFCLSISSEIYLRAQGVDAIYIPNTPKKMTEKKLPPTNDNCIACIGRFHDNKKQIGQTLLILNEVIKFVPDAKIIYIGGFEDVAKEEIFRKRIKDMKLDEHVFITGWTIKPEVFLDKCKIFLYTSYMEGFPNGIAEAQQRGLPGVMYYLDIMMAVENESIIQVQQGDFRTAAAHVVALLQNDEERIRLSKIALEQSHIYSAKRFEDELVDLLNHYDKYSYLREYCQKEYNLVINSLAYYVGKSVPEF